MEMSGNFFGKVSYIIEITAEYCLRITFYTLRGSAATLHR